MTTKIIFKPTHELKEMLGLIDMFPPLNWDFDKYPLNCSGTFTESVTLVGSNKIWESGQNKYNLPTK